MAPVRVLASDGRGTSIFVRSARFDYRQAGARRFSHGSRSHSRYAKWLGHLQQLGPRRRGERQFGARQPADHLHGVQISATAGLNKQRSATCG